MNEFGRLAIDTASTSVGLGLGSDLVSGIGGDTGALNTLSKYQAPVARLRGGNILINTLLDVNKSIKKSMRRK